MTDEQLTPMARLIGAIRTLAQLGDDVVVSEPGIQHDPLVTISDRKNRGRILCDLRILNVPRDSTASEWKIRDAVRTILGTAIEMASLAFAVERLTRQVEEERERSEGWIRSGQAYARDAEEIVKNLTIQLAASQAQAEAYAQDLRCTLDTGELLAKGALKKDREIAQLRHAAVYGLNAVAQCPSCLAERTNGERHADDCPLIPHMEDKAKLYAANPCPAGCEVLHLHRFLDVRDGATTAQSPSPGGSRQRPCPPDCPATDPHVHVIPGPMDDLPPLLDFGTEEPMAPRTNRGYDPGPCGNG